MPDDVFFYGDLRALGMPAQNETPQSAEAAYPQDVWHEAAQVMIAREREGSAEGFFLAAKAGHNLEPHRHSDIGNFVVWCDGRPILIDLGFDEDAAQAQAWYARSEYHNCPGVNGFSQGDGCAYRAEGVRYTVTDRESALSMEMKSAYPAEAGIVRWQRLISLWHNAICEVVVTDRFTLASPSGDIRRYLITPCAPTVLGGVIVLPYPGGAAGLRYDVTAAEAAVETVPTAESGLCSGVGGALYRIVLKERAPVVSAERTLRVRKMEA